MFNTILFWPGLIEVPELCASITGAGTDMLEL
jgi:hypothetical protein